MASTEGRADRRPELIEVLRRRILHAVRGQSLKQGDRLPSARELGAEFDVDHRIVLEAYRVLVGEGLVELRTRGGIYVGSRATADVIPVPAEGWVTDVLAEGAAREIPILELHDWLRRSVETLRLRAVAVQGTADQVAGLCRELADDYGLDVTGVDAATLTADGAVPPELRRADLLVTTAAYESLVQGVGERLGVPCIVVTVRPDLVGGEWRLLLRRPVYVVVRDEGFVPVLRQFLSEVPGVENLRPLVVGRDDLSRIPDDAPVYVTRSARASLGDQRIGGRIVPSARLFSSSSSRALIGFIVRENLAVVASRRPG